MIKPLWALAGVALLGTAGLAGVIVVASSGGEEEIIQQLQTATATVSPAPTPGPTAAPTTQVPTASPSPTPAPTQDAIPADWQTYTDSGLGFSVRYPPDLAVRDLTGPAGGLNNLRALDFRSGKDPSRAFALSVYQNISDLTPEEWARENTACHQESITGGVVAGRAAVFCTAEAIEGLLGSGAVFEHEGRIFYISSTIMGSEFETIVASVRLSSE